MSAQQTQTLNQKIKDVAKRIKTAREAVGISIEQAASELGITPAEYVKCEEGATDFSFTFIYKIAKLCGVEITDIMEGQSPILSTYTVTRKGEGTPIVRRKGFEYYRLAPLFKGKLAEPFLVTIPYSEEALSRPPHYSTHVGQELDIVISGTLKMIVGENSEILHEGDAIYYDSSNPHDEIALGGEPCSIYAVVMNPKGMAEYKEIDAPSSCFCNVDLAKLKDPVVDPFITTKLHE
ncbi:MAG: helix-turn-helix transcriptional regulator, partial [Clostridia bacterium]|nr:helix-turn-helix transcriptional regulator [Clostridia bacterium]